MRLLLFIHYNPYQLSIIQNENITIMHKVLTFHFLG